MNREPLKPPDSTTETSVPLRRRRQHSTLELLVIPLGLLAVPLLMNVDRDNATSIRNN